MNPLLLTDFYKIHHTKMYPDGMTKLYSNFTPRKSRMKGVEHVVVFGLQHFILEYLIKMFNEDFFLTKRREYEDIAFGIRKRSNYDETKNIESRQNALNKLKSGIISEYQRHCPVDTKHIEALWDLGYLPIEIKALDEGTLCPIGVPMLTITNTHPDFAWLVNYLETLLSAMLWQPITSATIAFEYKKLLTKYLKETDEKNLEFVYWQGHDFSMRGMSSIESAILSGMGHLTSFTGTDTIPAIYQLESSYSAKGLIGASVPATEHSVMCMGTKESEIETFSRLLKLYPEGILSVVSDTWDLWKVCTEYLPQLKDEVLARDGKLVIRPDSGDPVDIICGEANKYIDISTYFPKGDVLPEYFEDYLLEEVREDTPHGECGVEEYSSLYKINDKYYKATIHNISWNRYDKQYYFIDMYEDAEITIEEQLLKPTDKGVIELLWDIFGGTINDQGYKVLDPHIGAIYGDSINLERAEAICERLKAKGFASSNIVFGIGSFTYQYNTRDTFGFAMKATYGEITHHIGYDGDPATDAVPIYKVEPREIFKAPITDSGEKKSKKGLLKVIVPGGDGGSDIIVEDQQTWEQEQTGLLTTVFKDGKLVKTTTLDEIRERLNSKL